MRIQAARPRSEGLGDGSMWKEKREKGGTMPAGVGATMQSGCGKRSVETFADEWAHGAGREKFLVC